MIDKFTKDQFENTLFNIHPGFEPLGLIDGEEVYVIPVNENARLKVRSSVDVSGHAADSGQDSIRIWLEVWQPYNGNYQWRATGKKVDAYTTRVSGWPERLEKKVRKLWSRAVTVRKSVEQCDICKSKKAFFVSKSGKNTDRPFARCQCENSFEWLDIDSLEKGSKVKFEIDERELVDVPINSETQRCKSTHIQPVSGSDRDIVQETGVQAIKPADTLVSENEPIENVQEVYEKIPGYESLNDAQYQAATSPLDVNIRLLAPPGSGKTHTIKYRYQFLVDNGVNPDNILVVTFSKAMADEMAAKIAELVMNANVDQISTIHAFCFRLIKEWYPTPYNGWNFSKKSWKIKSILEDLIAVIWQSEEKPNYNEALDWINSAKYYNQFNQEFFTNALGNLYGNWLWIIAEIYQQTMQNNQEVTFADMLMYTEQLLENDDKFRAWCHNRFKQIIVDESQDTNWQAMKILLAISENVKPSELPLDK